VEEDEDLLTSSKRTRSARPWRCGVLLALLALALVAASFLLQGDIGINLTDEGYLWYGASAILRGQVPLRDFQSYDPGRYYWVAAWFRALGDHGIIPLRIACAAFNVLGVWCGLLVLRRLSRAWYFLVPSGALLTLCAFPAFMLNYVFALAAVYFALLVLESPSAPRHFAAGAFVGVTAFFMRNFGAFAFISLAAIMLLTRQTLSREERRRRELVFGAGIAVGYTPALFMFVALPGFWQANVDIVRLLGEIGATNLTKPVPWPWEQSSFWDVCVGLLFLLDAVFYVLAIGWMVVLGRTACLRRPVFVAATVAGIPFLHYAFSRADVEHLAMTIHPLLIAILALPFEGPRKWRTPAVGLALGVTAVCVLTFGAVNPWYQRFAAAPGWYVRAPVGGWNLWLPRFDAELIAGAVRFNANVVRPDEGFLIVPQAGPGLYAILNRESPLAMTLFGLRHPEWRQKAMIEDLERKHVNWILFEDKAIDGSEERRFRVTHRLIWEYMVKEFEMVPEGLPGNFHLLRRKK